ncbi:MAG: 1-(5-phosphoribosyl)-5-[(5-phosphoribosylamino)methylideneamino]imidazole-4-carboxamide isomerase, partial [Actinobacteria bacterium]|nr:1-(5-phosphoribosyl)-5-[(5-phosphoribosylamino)methylideneamino]imidazole-4-carboxamide isomerase [Actinomycetota bacterium]
MLVIPAIDIIEGKCVRLTRGDFNTKKFYCDDPVEVA